MVDLDALRRKLEAAGWSAAIVANRGERHVRIPLQRGDGSLIQVYDDGEVFSSGIDWSLMDIIRRHVAPPEPVVLTDEEERTFRIAVNDCPYGLEGDAAMDWFAEHGFALVRTTGVK